SLITVVFTHFAVLTEQIPGKRIIPVKNTDKNTQQLPENVSVPNVRHLVKTDPFHLRFLIFAVRKQDAGTQPADGTGAAHLVIFIYFDCPSPLPMSILPALHRRAIC